ncbi:MAG: hypothetical protein K2Q20_04765 [Phycisphaerales bacterium]|nr:hypothetical protein [Phycisphaerales bacterium]
MDPLDTRGDLLRTFLADRDEPCPACGYNLRGLRGDRCVECANQLALSVRMTEPRTGLIVGAIGGLMCGAAPHAALLLLLGVIGAWFGAGGRLFSEAWFWLGIPALITLMLGGTALFLGGQAGRRWFRRLSPASASAAVMAAFGLSVLCHAGFVTIGIVTFL